MRIRLYDDAGAGPFVTACLGRELSRATGGTVRPILANEVVAGDDWHRGCDLLAIPGGADRPYAQKLDGRGNQSIRRYVEAGGRLLGVCAGAYYCCRRIDFAGADFAVREPRELGLFAGTAVGSLVELAPPYRADDVACAAAVEVDSARLLYWGGCRFDADADSAAEIIARYAVLPPGRDVAAVRAPVGRGVAVLCGYHAEVSGDGFAGHSPAVAEILRAHENQRRRHFDHLIARLRAADGDHHP